MNGMGGMSEQQQWEGGSEVIRWPESQRTGDIDVPVERALGMRVPTPCFWPGINGVWRMSNYYIEAETPILGAPDEKSWLIEKTLMLGKIEGRRRILHKGVFKRYRQISYDVAYIWNLKHGTNELIYKREIRVQMKKTNLWLPGGKRQGGITWEVGIDIHTRLYIK